MGFGITAQESEQRLLMLDDGGGVREENQGRRSSGEEGYFFAGVLLPCVIGGNWTAETSQGEKNRVARNE